MQTTPPIVIARAENAVPVQPMTRNMAHVAIRVAMAMPEIGLEELPINPVMRDETVTKRNPKTTTRIAAKKLLAAEVSACAITRENTLSLKVSKIHMITSRTPEPTNAHLRLMS